MPDLPPPSPASGKLPQRAGFGHGEKLAARHDAEHRPAADVTLLSERDQIVEQRARDLRPQFAAHMQVRLEPAGYRLLLETQRVARPCRNPVVDIGAKLKDTTGC